MNRHAGGDPVLLLLAAGASLMGGLLAMGMLAIVSHVKWPLIAGLIVLVAGLSVFAVAMFMPESHSTVTPWPGRDGPDSGHPIASQSGPQQPAPTWPGVTAPMNAWAGWSSTESLLTQTATARRWNPAQPSTAETAPVNIAVPIRGGASTTVASAGAPGLPPAQGGSAAVAGLSDCASDVAVTQIVQCPRCGDFAVEVRNQKPGFALSCKVCGNDWRWKPGSAWPTTVVRPRLKRRQDLGDGAESI
jgi:hypothetical protein